MNSSSLLERLKQIGFSEYEAKCYLALFERESLAVSDVSKLAGIPRSNAYEAMEKLLGRGLIVSIPGKMKRYAVSDPWVLREKSLDTLNTSMETELENIERRRKEILDMKIKEMLDRKKAIQDNIDSLTVELETRFKVSRHNGGPLDYIEVIKEPIQILRRYMQLCQTATREIVVFSRPPYSFSNQKQQDEQDKTIIEALNRGVKIRSIYEVPTVKSEDILANNNFQYWMGHGEQIRVTEELPIKLAVFDEKTVILPLEDPIQGKQSLTSLVAEHGALAKSLHVLFECYWEKAKDFKEITARKTGIARPKSVKAIKKKHNKS
jgi:HTH-type transcriptional regulator, sugar sensing transcriptional regulator